MWGAAARARSISGFSPGEFLVSVLLIGIMAALSASVANIATSHVSQIELLNLSTIAKIYWIEQWANNGRDVLAAPFAADSDRGRYAVGIPSELGDGSFSYELLKPPPASDSAVITFRPVFAADPQVTSVAWICGNAVAPPGFAAVGDNLTNVPAKHLVSACRERL